MGVVSKQSEHATPRGNDRRGELAVTHSALYLSACITTLPINLFVHNPLELLRKEDLSVVKAIVASVAIVIATVAAVVAGVTTVVAISWNYNIQQRFCACNIWLWWRW